MTAEIAIVNRSAITLAADSAMTISVSGRRKVYLTDKIFELSEADPIGLMIYNNLEFMGAPIEVLIKQFRASEDCVRFAELKDSPSTFFNYLTGRWNPSGEIQKRHGLEILSYEYRRVFSDFEREMRPRRGQDLPINVLMECIERAISRAEGEPVSECFKDVPEEDLENFYAESITQAISKELHEPPLDDGQSLLCRRLGLLILHRDVFSDIMTGFVFAGFGREDTFPSLQAFEIDGIILNKLKWRQVESVSTNRDHISAHVLPFAQRDVVDRFLVGIDPQLEEWIKGYFENLSERTIENLFKGTKLSGHTKSILLSNLAATFSEPVNKFADHLEDIKKSYSKETEDMVLFMAKQESAHLAESLVNITSLKRKYSPDEESVSGPIDVAVISRSDGFVWVKRKHYFPPQLNGRFFARKYGRQLPDDGEQNGTEAPQ